MTEKITDNQIAEILVIDDNIDDLKLLSEILKNANYKVRPANEGALALRSVKAKKPDIILLDLHLPDIDGIEVCRQLKADPITKSIPIIFVSASIESELKLKAFNTGAVDYIIKPFDTAEILARIATHLNIYQLQQKVEASERKFRSYIENAPDGVFIANEKGKFVEVNKAACDISEYSEKELLELSISEIVQKEYLEKAENHFQTVVKNGFSTDEIGFKTKSGKNRFWNVDAVKLSDIRFLGFVKDITKNKKNEDDLLVANQQLLENNSKLIAGEKALQESEIRFKHAAMASSDFIYEWDIENDSLKWFGDIDEFLGYKPNEIPQTIAGWTKLIHPNDLIRLKKSVEHHRTSTEQINEEYRVAHKNGSWRYWKDQGLPILNNNGKPYKWIGSCTDITESKTAEEKIRVRIKQLEILNEATVNREFKIIEMKKEINELLKKSGEKTRYIVP